MDKLYHSVEYCAWLREQAKLKRPYWYGTCFQKCTESLLTRKAAQYAAEYKADRMARYHADIDAGQICGDCVGGAIKGAAWTMLSTQPWEYASHGVLDLSANDMFEWCKSLGVESGKISTIPDRPGIAVRMNGHVGVYVGNGEVVEWRGFDYGCVVTKLSKRSWLDWYELPWVEYAEGQIVPVRRTLRKGKKGEDVREVQQKLIDLGYDLGCWGADGDFGAATEEAVKAFQTANGLEVDGIVGPATWAALDAADTAAQKYTVILRGLDQAEMAAIKNRWPNCEVKKE